MSSLQNTFNELEFTGEHYDKSKGYPYYAILRLEPGIDMTERQNFLEELACGLKGIDYWFFADVAGRVRYGFKSEQDREALFAARTSDDFDYNVRKRMEAPGPAPRR